MEGRYIGRIDIEDEYSCVDLPEGMPKEIAGHLRKVMVCGRPLKLRLLASEGRSPRGQKESNRPPKPRAKSPTGRKGKRQG